MEYEIWKIIPDFVEYQVSNFGRIKSLKCNREKILKPVEGKKGYFQVSLCKNSKAYKKQIHQVVLQAFIGPCPKGLEVNHKNGIKSDNRLDNLEYMTHAENNKHAIQTGLHKEPSGDNHYTKKHPEKVRRGSNSNLAKLTEEQIKKIRALWNRKEKTQKEISILFNIHKTTVSYIVNNKVWQHIR